jgi:L-2-hydroxyglutarate oxidase LhgO
LSDDLYEIDCLVIGAGVVGLAAAAQLAKSGRGVFIVETHTQLGSETSSRNSGVIHAGLYYPTNSHKHRFCVAGRRKLYPYLESHGVAHRKCGKLIVATNIDEEEKLHALLRQARANDVEGVELISGAQVSALEPSITCREALISPETGILDQGAYVQALAHEFEMHGGVIVRASPFLSARALPDGRLEAQIGGEQPSKLLCGYIVNAAGLHAQNVAAHIEGLAPERIPTLSLAKGSYFTLPGRAPFQRLIYPLPGPAGLGVHATLDLSGQVRFGPDVEFLDHNDPLRIDYRVDIKRSESFEAIIQTYWPDMPQGALLPDYAGCRPKLSAGFSDFRIDGEDVHGVPGLINLFGIESPGLTSSLAIAEEIAGRMSAGL